MRTFRRLFAVAIAAALAPVALLAQEAAVVTGTVTNTQGQPEAAVLVRIEALNVGATTGPDGTYRLVVPGARVRPGQSATITASRQGLGTQSRSVTLNPGAQLTQNFTLAPQALLLDQVVVTGVAGETTRAKLPITVNTVSGEELQHVPAVSAAGALQGRVEGATVVSGSGRPGSGHSVMLRAPTSINATGRSQEPMYIVDGVILGSSSVDIDALDIESIEVVKGAAAASLYGSRAGNGVIQIRTRSGRGMPTDAVRYTLRADYGSSSLANPIQVSQLHHYRMNAAGTKFVTAGGVEFDWGEIAPGGAFYTPTFAGTNAYDTFRAHAWPGQTYDHVSRFFDPGNYFTTSVSAEGRQGNTNFLASLSHLDEDGVIWNQPGYDRQTFRLNLDQQIADNFQLSARSYYARSFAGQFPESSGSPLFNLTRMPAGVDISAIDPATGEFLYLSPDVVNTDNANPLEALSKRHVGDNRERFLGSMALRFTPMTWMDLSADLSYDRSGQQRNDLYEHGYRTPRANLSFNSGNLRKDNWISEALNASVTSTLRRQFGDLSASTQFRYLVESQDNLYHRAQGERFVVPGIPTLQNTSPAAGHRTIQSTQQDIRSEGYYAIGNLDFRDRYILDALIRRDGSSLFGPQERWQTYYRLAGAWRMSEEPFWDGMRGVLEDAKLRYSVGTAGGRPNFSAQYETYTVSGGALMPVALGNDRLRPEFIIEREGGLELYALGRLGLQVVNARTTARDQILPVPLPAISGWSYQWANAGTLESNTWEAALDARVLDQGRFSWNSRLMFDRTRQHISQLNVPEFQTGFPDVQGLERVFYVREGEALGTFYGTRFARSCSDLPAASQPLCGTHFATNDDGFLVYVGQGGDWRTNEQAQWGPTQFLLPDNRSYVWGMPFAAVNEAGESFLPIGSTQPDFNWRLSNTLNFGGLSLYSLFDATVGVHVYNLPRHWATFQHYSADVDQVGKPQDAWKPIAYYSALYNALSPPNDHFVEDGSFVKLRELSLRYRFTGDQLAAVPFLNGAQGLALNLSGRNLITWTNYQGFDPEVGFAGGTLGSAAIARFDGFSYPNFRTLTAGVELTF